MDTFENNEFPEVGNEQGVTPEQEPAAEEVTPPQPQFPPQPQYTPQPDPTAYHSAGAGRKESPYANSPYVMNPQAQGGGYQAYQYQPQTQRPEQPRKPKKAKKPIWKTLVASLLVVALVAGGCLITAKSVNEYWEERNKDTVEMLTRKIEALQKQIDSDPASDNFATVTPPVDNDVMTPGQLYRYNVDSVVAISSTVESYMYGQGASSGSGFILSEDGYVVTNYHVVEDAVSIDVVMHDGTEYPAEIAGYDSSNDIAVLKVDAEGLPAATIGSSSDLVIGDMVVAIGNPLGELTATQTVGYVSGINREVTTDNTIISMIQTDAAINPGNSGGPLFNMYGQVIGITTAKYSGTTGSGASIEGIGFAIPIDDVMGIISDLVDYGYVTGAYLGITVQNTDAESAAMFDLPVGAYVVSVEKDYAAERAGIKAKDIIIDLGGYDVGSITDLTRALRNFKAGDTTTITVIRSGAEMTLDITLDEKPQDLYSAAAPEEDSSMPSDGSYEEWYDYFRRYFGG